jgi:hypothetical protein
MSGSGNAAISQPSATATSWRTGLLLLIVLGGGLLRLAGLYWGEGYRISAIFDELNAYETTLQTMAGIHPLYLGQPHFNSGHVPGPLWTIFWIVPLRWSGSVQAVTAVMILLNTLTIYVVSVLAGRLFGERYRLWAALIYATSPWVVYFSVGCWNPELLAPVGALLYLALWQVMTRPFSRSIFWVCLLLGMLPQFHMFVVFLVPPVLLLLGLRFRQLNKTWLALGLLAAAALYIPYVLGEAAHGWQNTREVLAGHEPFSWGCLKSLSTPIGCLSNLIASAFGTDPAEYRDFANRACGGIVGLAILNVLSIGLAVVWIASFVQSIKRTWRDRQPLSPYLFVGILLFGPMLLFVLTGHSFNSRYCILLFPLLFLLPAVFIADLSFAGWPQRLLGGACVVTIVANIAVSLIFFHDQRQQIAGADYFVSSFPKMDMVYQTLKAQAGPGHPIRIDTSAFNGLNTHLVSDKRTRGVLALARYVEIREQAAQWSHVPGPSEILYARPAGKSFELTERLLYEGNGLAIIGKIPIAVNL